jgi:hypothetical protein
MQREAMINLNNIHSLTDFQRNTKEHIERLKDTGMPEILTVNGRSELVVQDAESYQKVLDYIDKLEAIAGIKRGLGDILEGRTKPSSQAFKSIKKKLKIP